MNILNNIIVVGGNAAGPSAAAKAKRTNPDARVIMFEASPFISTGTCELPYVISGEIETYRNIVFYDEKSFKEHKGVDVFTNHLVTSINRRQKKITVKNLLEDRLDEYEYDKLVLCTGSTANRLTNLEPDLDNLFYLKNVTDLNFLSQYLNDNHPRFCLILGAGYIGLEAADAISKKGIKVNLAEKNELPLPNAEPEVQNIVKDALLKNGINFIPQSEKIKIFSNNKRITKFKNDGRLTDIDFVLSSIGFSPNVDLANSYGIEIGKTGAIRVNRKLQTSDPHIYAAGDNMEVVNRITGRQDYLPLATIAHEAGHIAGANAAGENEVFSPILKNIAVKFFNVCFAQVGLTVEEASMYFNDVMFVNNIANNKVHVMPDSTKTFGKVVFRKSNKQILGASFVGSTEVTGYADLIASLIHTKAEANVLSEITYNYTPPLSPFINLLSKLGRQINRKIG